MEMVLFKMEIIDLQNSFYKIKISNDAETAIIEFNPLKKELHFIDNNNLTSCLKNNEYQLRKILHNKRIDTYYVGFNINFVLKYNKDVAAFNDRSKIVVLDKRNNSNISYVINEDKWEKNIYKIFSDACYFENKKYGGFAFIVKDLEGNYTLHTEKVHDIGSSQAELMAVINALELLKDIEKVRIVTDSQYVRKGLTEWIPCWKLNDFKTINGEPVKSIENWLRFDKVCNEKYIEFQWIKGHSNHFENTLCDMYARTAAKSEKI